MATKKKKRRIGMSVFGKKEAAKAFVFLFALLLFGCGGSKMLKVEPIPKTENPANQVAMLENEVNNARKNQLNVLVPSSFARAETYLGDAKKGLDRGEEISGILRNVSLGRAQIKHAEEQVQVVRTALADVIKAREFARAAGAASLGEDYATAEEDFLNLTKAIENDNLSRAQRNQGKVAESFRKLELRAIKDQTLGEVRQLIEQAERDGARKFAPGTLAFAKKKLSEADAFITENPYKKEEMRNKAGEALFHAQRANQISGNSQKLKTMETEEIALWMEEILQKTTSKLSAPDMRNQPVDTQVENILGSIAALQSDHQFMVDKARDQEADIETMKKENQARVETMKNEYETEIEAREKRIATLEGQTREEQIEKERLMAERRAAEEKLAAEKQAAEERLAAERRFNEKFLEVQGYFDQDEAEVYKKGNHLVIRLREIQFPVGKAVIMPDNYGLLSKVQRSIRTFGEPDVVVEGHTDSTGSDVLNEILSEQRATAVREYFVANETLKDDKIVAIGYGSQRPLASNQTQEGRAINRRIDVIISPPPQMGQ
jgi:outer membrane protein OmpA-like peptidoglycan-associated protein